MVPWILVLIDFFLFNRVVIFLAALMVVSDICCLSFQMNCRAVLLASTLADFTPDALFGVAHPFPLVRFG